MAEASISLPATRTGHYFAQTTAYDSYVHQGDIYNLQGPVTVRQEPDEIVHYGLCLNLAPSIDPSYFIGRAEEIDTIKEILHPSCASTEQRRLVLGGFGGIGKTQLALTYAQRHRTSYSSVFWLNATSELTIKAGFRLVTERVLSRQEVETLDDEQALARTFMWLADVRNTQWLLIFDNYDEPDQFDIEKYCPYAGHGSIIITTRRPDLVTGRSIRIQHLTKIKDSLGILQTRSGRENIHKNPDARLLAERMHGLPLALATAGAYLRQSTYTFKQYLQAYEQRWQIDWRRPVRLQEYHDRTLYTTWSLSYSRLKAEDPDAAHLLKLLAYFDNQEIWYKLFQVGLSAHSPGKLQTLLIDQDNFENVIRTLMDYCLVEVHHTTQTYSIHSCVHDWTLGELNQEIDPQLYWYAFDCVAASINRDDYDRLGYVQYTRVSRHGLRLTYLRFSTSDNLKHGLFERLEEAELLANMLKDQVQLSAAEQMYQRVLAGKETALGPDHPSTLGTVNNLGVLYADQGKLDQAEQMYQRALARKETILGPDHTSTLSTVNNLGVLYADQGKLDQAEQMYQRVLTGEETVLGPDHTSTLDTVNNLGVLYADQGKLDQAGQMYQRALAGKETALGPNHTSTLNTVNNLGNLYRDQGKLDQAEQMYQRALAGYETVLGPDHTSTLETVNNLGILYSDQGKLDQAEQMYQRALAGYETVLGPNHTSTLDSKHCLANLYCIQSKLNEADLIYKAILPGYEQALGDDHPSTMMLVNNFGLLRQDQGRFKEAEGMLQRALVGYQKRLGPDHPKTRSVMDALTELQCRQDEETDITHIA